MSAKIENLEKNMVKFTIEVSAEEFDKYVEKAYLKQKGKISLPGFRKGKVPRKMVEKMYGKEVFFEGAANECIPAAYQNALEENKDVEVVSRPEIDVVTIKNGEPFVFTATVAVKPEVELGQYKEISIPKVSVRVTAKEVESALQEEQEKNARHIDVTDRAVKDGDEVLLDFDGYVDGKQFEGGKSENYPLTIGSGSFIPGFEEQLIGAEIGKDLEVNVKFPEEYHAADLKGKEAIFKCKINGIKERELPELNDEFASDVSEFDTLEDWKKDIKEKIKKNKTDMAKNDQEQAAIDTVIENAKMEIPEGMLNLQLENMINDYAMRIQQQGISMEQYMQLTGLTKEKLNEQMKPEALKRIQSSLVLEAIAKQENLEVSDEDFDKKIEEMAKVYQMEAEKIKSFMGENEKDQMKKDMLVEKALEFVISNGVEESKSSKKSSEK